MRKRLQEIKDKLDNLHFTFPDSNDEGGKLLREAIRIVGEESMLSDQLRITLNDEYKVYRMTAMKSRATRKSSLSAWQWFISDFKTDMNSLLFLLKETDDEPPT